MATFVLVHGSTHGPGSWKFVRAELERNNHTVVTPELPSGEPEAGAGRYAEVIVSAIPTGEPTIVAAHSASGWYLPLVAATVPLRRMVFVAAVIPRLGISFLEQLQSEPEMINAAWIGKDPRLPAVADEFLFHDVPPERLEWAHSTMRVMIARHAMIERYPLREWPSTPGSYIVCSMTGRSSHNGRGEWLFPLAWTSWKSREVTAHIFPDLKLWHRSLCAYRNPFGMKGSQDRRKY